MNFVLSPKFEQVARSGGGTLLVRKRKPWHCAYALIANDTEIYAYPFGRGPGAFFETVEQAHAHLLSTGSKSPWQRLNKLFGDE